MSFPLSQTVLPLYVDSADAQSTSINGKIAYIACGPSSIPFTPDQCDIWVMNPDGTGQTNLTNTTDKNEVSPSWSPDGTKIAYFEGFTDMGLRIMNADGSNPSPAPITITNAWPYTSTPTWSPGGTQIAFVRNNPGSPVSIQADIVVVDLATGSETVISRPADFGGVLLDADEIEPAWSPDGGKIAFAGVRLEQYADPITGDPIQGAQWEIITVNPDGGGEQIISAGAQGSVRAQNLEEDRAPDWSPDGTKLVFMSQAQAPSCCGPWQIWAVNRDGTGASNLTNDETVNDLWPKWSPDGTQIIFSRADAVGRFDLYTMPAPTTLPVNTPLAAPLLVASTSQAAAAASVTRLTNTGNASNPDWARDPQSGQPNNLYALYVSVSVEGKGADGTVASSPRGIKCGRDCTESYLSGTAVALIATPKRGTTFSGWSGACAQFVGPTCSLTMDDVKTVKASFIRSR